MTPRRPPYLGLTGGIASGKSTAARAFRAAGAAVIDADQLARDVVAPGSPGLERVQEAFGAGVLTPDGSLDREALAGRVFAAPGERARLEAIVHPLVAAAAMARRRQLQDEDPSRLVVYDVPLLYEVGMEEQFDRVAVVYVPRAVQLQRLLARDGIARDEAEQRLGAQMDIEEKARRADEVLDNSGTPAELEGQVAALVARMQRPGRDSPPFRG